MLVLTKEFLCINVSGNKMRLSITFLLLIGLHSCETRRSVPIKVEKYNRGELMKTFPLERIRIVDKFENKETFLFRSELADSVYTFEVFARDKSKITFWAQECKRIDTKEFNLNGTKLKIYKYRYDIPTGMDEELDFYVTSDGEILGLKEWAWVGHEIFVTEDNKEIINALIADTTTFFKYNFRVF